jgi:nucleotide-binding universal stress UspA family protein
MIQRILAALDGSFRAPDVFDAAVEVAEKFDSTIYVLRAISFPQEWQAAAAGSHTDPLPAYLTRAALEELGCLMVPVASRRFVVAPPLVRVGEAWKVIVAVSNELDVDLIVIGSHGYRGLDRLLGTNAGRVVNLARRNVLVVHDPAQERDPP